MDHGPSWIPTEVVHVQEQCRELTSRVSLKLINRSFLFQICGVYVMVRTSNESLRDAHVKGDLGVELHVLHLKL